MDTAKIDKITKALTHYQNDDKIPCIPILEELESILDFNKQYQIKVIFYQFSNELTELLP